MNATAYAPELLAYHQRLARGFAHKYGFVVTSLDYNAYTALWMLHLKSQAGGRTVCVHEARIVDVCKAIKEAA